jgi:hypothetical protein
MALGERGDLGGIVEHDRPGVLVEPLSPVEPGLGHGRANLAQVVHDVATAGGGVAVALEGVQRAAVPDERRRHQLLTYRSSSPFRRHRD